MGAGAVSFVAGTRFTTVRDVTKFLTGDFVPRERLMITNEIAQKEFVMLGLRMNEGVSQTKFLEMFGVPIEKVFSKFQVFLDEGWLVKSCSSYCLSDKGQEIGDRVISEIIS